ncbi:MAG: translation initiation factor IF-2 subunit alpha [Thermoprotei archaeon]
MAILRREKYPYVGMGVVATVEKLEEHGAYVTIDSFNGIRGYLPINEIASGWVKNIHDYVKEGRKIPLKVIMVDPSKGQIVLSLKKISAGEQDKTYSDWNKEKKVEAIVMVAAKALNKKKEDAYKEVIWPLKDKYGDAYSALTLALKEGDSALKNANISKAWVDALYPLIQKHVKTENVTISFKVSLFYEGKGGINKIKSAFSNLIEWGKSKNVLIKASYLSAPNYLIKIEGSNYKELESISQEMKDFLADYVKKTGTTVSIERLKS